eukprot:10510231-Lingulodinium_polyedra.AAC.1
MGNTLTDEADAGERVVFTIPRCTQGSMSSSSATRSRSAGPSAAHGRYGGVSILPGRCRFGGCVSQSQRQVAQSGGPR